MELFLNLCWLALLLPAYVLWRRRVSSEPWTRASFVIICTLGCAFVLLFPVISASDDLHAVGQAMEESERGFRHDGHCPFAAHSVQHASLSLEPGSVSQHVTLEQLGSVVPFSPKLLDSVLADSSSTRAPPLSQLLSL